ncbi:LPS export ABC transporter periplasmic protein LptC [Komagataeibacter oboediens]|uniref:LPS export ABC transporter periplasmic protein LptC n=1 Tax=Komagataeibacter oboediens TaxID=65958 RepID=A0ABS5SHZ6_9PROT|nr:LPS export ABC transporter periplasmic protein LptC [Komagataeibacter oboediens]MBL7233690.1 LPS export ABC transporter periplasmic protein LptC [Komagataeibacter oboediens]MBT0673920.1 LPS export ABC transporter periplasmic protein LptC [Komagataeibacter oboediens]MBT0677357.1 LPS export ABC transporter periplasmic protein LptC [Komagataeibacter oboediens]
MTDQPDDNRDDGTDPNQIQREDYARSAADIERQRSIFDQSTRTRLLPNAADLARRQAIMRSAKWMLPLLALILLGSIAAWPAVQRAVIMHTGTMAQMSHVRVKSGSMLNPTYRGLDDHGRPYMVTADEARQISAERIDLSNPAADTLMDNGNWMYVTARDGVYIQHAQLLDLTHDVTVYRNDGALMLSPSADVDMRHNIIVTDSWIHGEGPIGEIDVQGGMLDTRGGIMLFRGPGRMILNAAERSN